MDKDFCRHMLREDIPFAVICMLIGSFLTLLALAAFS